MDVKTAFLNGSTQQFLGNENGYRRSPADDCIYVKTVKRDDGFISFVILAVYVDDIIPVSNNVKMLKAEKES